MRESAGIDWQTVKRRLHEGQERMEKLLGGGPEQLERVLRERAAAMAARIGADRAPMAVSRVLAFVLGAERFALAVEDLVEIAPFRSCTPVPWGPPQLLGVCNFHGEIRSVVDLGKLLGLPEGESAGSGFILLVQKQGRKAALRVDDIDAIHDVSPGDLAALPGESPDEGGSFLRGLTPDGLRLLRTDAVLTHPLFAGVSGN